MPTYKTPGVYVEEISTFPPSVAEVATAIPAFIGYTEKGPKHAPTRISSLVEFVDLFGGPLPATFEVDVEGDGNLIINRTGMVDPTLATAAATAKTDLVTKKEAAATAKTALETAQAANPQEPATVTAAQTALVTANTNVVEAEQALAEANAKAVPKDFLMYYSLKMFFNNGGGPCYIVSVGKTSGGDWVKQDFEDGIDALRKEDEPTLFVLADATNLDPADYLGLCQRALDQCGELKDRFTIIDVPQAPSVASEGARILKDSTDFRGVGLGTQMKYGGCYYPYLQTTLNYVYDESGVAVNWPPTFEDANIKVTYGGDKDSAKLTVVVDGAATKDFTFNASPESATVAKLVITVKDATGKQLADAWQTFTTSDDSAGFTVDAIGDGATKVVAVSESTLPRPKNSLKSLESNSTQMHNQVKAALTKKRVVLPPSPAMAGIYAKTDRERGVWKAPANVSVASVIGPTIKITDAQQRDLNVDANAGKSINAIRSFIGKGTLVWGGRTLAGNDNEWRYINVRRLFNMIEESTQKASAFAVFEGNDATTWLKVKGMIESYLYGLWEQGALAGPTPDSAYFVNVGLGKTMTPQDILEGRMNVEIGVAAVRPAEFIILKFSHKLQEA